MTRAFFAYNARFQWVYSANLPLSAAQLMGGEGAVSLGGLYGRHDAFPIAMGVGWGRHSLGLLRIGRMVTLEPHLYLKVHCHRACQWGNPVVTLFSSTISKSSHGMRNVGSIREQSNASTLIFNEVHCALHGRTKHHDGRDV